MNERIKELAEQAGWDISEIMKFQNAIKMQKFAELIVSECAEVASDYDGAHYVGTAIKEHFGVEE